MLAATFFPFVLFYFSTVTTDKNKREGGGEGGGRALFVEEKQGRGGQMP